jgi:ABC-type multidrug transport system ATPase subunit
MNIGGARGWPSSAGETTGLLVNATTSEEDDAYNSSALNRSCEYPSKGSLKRADSNWSPMAFSVFRSQGAAIAFKDVTIVRKPMFRFLHKSTLLVQSACGYFEPGKLHGIVDLENEVASKALLLVLAGAALPAAGSVTSNGVPVASTVFRRVVGFVSDKNVAIMNFTAHANCMFALKMRQKVSTADAEALVSSALAAVEISPAVKAKAMSHEELFRLNVAMELVIDPPVIFSAFPVETLEAHCVGQCIHSLQRICRRMNKTVVMSLKSLPLQTMEQLDSLLLLGLDGQAVFSGETGRMLPYFSSLNIDNATLCWSPLSPPRRRLDPAAGKTQSPSREGSANSRQALPGAMNALSGSMADDASSMRTVSVRREASAGVDDDETASTDLGDVDSAMAIDSGDVVVDVLHMWSESSATTMKYAAAFYDSEERRITIDAVDRQDREPNFLSFAGHNPPPAAEKVARLMWYHTQQSLFQPDFYILWACLFLLLGLATWMASSQNEDQRGMQNIRGIMFFLFSIVVQGNGELVHNYVGEVRTFVLHRDGGFYGSVINSFVLALRLLTSRCVYLATFAVFIFAMLGNRSELVSLIAATSIAHAAIVYFIALCSPSERVAAYVCHVLLAYSAIFSGFLINLASVPVPISKMSVIYYGYAAAVSHVLRDKPYNCDSTNTTASYCYTGDAYIALEGFENDTTETNVKQLALIAVLFFVACCVRMQFVKFV